MNLPATRPAKSAKPWWKSPWFWALLIWFNAGPVYFEFVAGPIMEKSRHQPREYLVSPRVDAVLASPVIVVPLGAFSSFPVDLLYRPLNNSVTWMKKTMGYPGLNTPEVYHAAPFRRPVLYLSTLILASGGYFFMRRARYEWEIIRLEDEAAARSGGDSGS